MVSRPSEKVAAIFRWFVKNADIILLAAIGLGAILILTGCRAGGSSSLISRFFGTGPSPTEVLKTDINAALQPLVWTGGLCIPVGVVVLFITKLERGWIFIGCGIGLCVLSWLLSMFAIWIMLIVCPIIIVLCLYYGWTVFKSLDRNGGVFSHWRKGKTTWVQSDGQSSPVSAEESPSGSSSPS